MFEGKTIRLIKPVRGVVAGQQKSFELWTQGEIITISKPEEVKAIDKTIQEAKKYGFNVRGYLQYMIDKEGLLN